MNVGPFQASFSFNVSRYVGLLVLITTLSSQMAWGWRHAKVKPLKVRSLRASSASTRHRTPHQLSYNYTFLLAHSKGKAFLFSTFHRRFVLHRFPASSFATRSRLFPFAHVLGEGQEVILNPPSNSRPNANRGTLRERRDWGSCHLTQVEEWIERPRVTLRHNPPEPPALSTLSSTST